MRSLVLSLSLAWLLGGCVSTSRYENLKKQHDAAQSALAAANTKLSAQDATLAQQREAQAALEAKLGHEQKERADLEARRAALAQENEGLLTELQALSKDRKQLAATRDRLKESLAALEARKAEAERRAAEFRSMLDRFKSLIDAGRLSVRMVEGRMVLVLPSDVLFDSGSAQLSKDGKAAVHEVGAALATMPDRRFQVEGHTDNIPIKNEQFKSNWELASGRALGVLQELLAAGMQGSQLSAASYGELHPVMTNDSPQGRRENRRIEIVLLPDLSTLPGLEEIKSTVAR